MKVIFLAFFWGALGQIVDDDLYGGIAGNLNICTHGLNNPPGSIEVINVQRLPTAPADRFNVTVHVSLDTNATVSDLLQVRLESPGNSTILYSDNLDPPGRTTILDWLDFDWTFFNVSATLRNRMFCLPDVEFDYYWLNRFDAGAYRAADDCSAVSPRICWDEDFLGPIRPGRDFTTLFPITTTPSPTTTAAPTSTTPAPTTTAPPDTPSTTPHPWCPPGGDTYNCSCDPTRPLCAAPLDLVLTIRKLRGEAV